MTDIKYPIGRVEIVPYSDKVKNDSMADILFLPRTLEYAVLNLSEKQLHTPYREDGWTTNQIVHHLADSHMNAFVRFKLGLTEDHPTIKPYDQNKWAETADVSNVAVNISITMLHALHHRWYELLKTLNEEDFNRTVYHPEQERDIPLWNFLLIYAWHGKHHATQITQLRERMGW